MVIIHKITNALASSGDQYGFKPHDRVSYIAVVYKIRLNEDVLQERYNWLDMFIISLVVIAS